MDKMFRNIDEKKMMEAKATTIEHVMNEITKPRLSFRKWFVFPPILITAVTIAAIMMFGNNQTDTPPNPTDEIVLTNYESGKLAEVSYMSGSIISSAFANMQVNTSIMMLSDQNESEFEGNITEFNTYFDMLIVFIDNTTFEDDVTILESDKEGFDSRIIFTQDGSDFIFYVTITGETLEGELYVDAILYDVEGTYKQSNEQVEIKLKATNNNNYIEIEYKSETKEDVEKKYEIKQEINGVYKEKEINIKLEPGDTKIEISENEDSYELESEFEDGVLFYVLEYEIAGVDGEVMIIPTTDEFGNKIYSYIIDEGDYHNEIDLEDPDEEDDEEEEDQSSTGMQPNIKKIF